MRKRHSLWHQAHFLVSVTQNTGCTSTLLRLDNEQLWIWIKLEWGGSRMERSVCPRLHLQPHLHHLSLPFQSQSCAELTLNTALAAQCRSPGALSLFCGAVPLGRAHWAIPFDKATHKCSQLAETKLCCFTAVLCTSARCFTIQERLKQLLSPLLSRLLPAPTKFPLTWHILHKTAELPETWNMAKYHFIVKP